MTVLRLPDPSLVVLVGVSCSGKSSFAARHFGPFEVVSSDFCRGVVSNDVNDQAASADAFTLLDHIAGVRLTRGLLTVIDATNVTAAARKGLVRLARDHDLLPVAIVLDIPESVARERNRSRSDRDFGDRVIHRQAGDLRRGLKGLAREGFRAVHILRGVEEVDAAVIERVPLLTDRRDLHGPFDVIGDVHGCLPELLSLLDALGYAVIRDPQGRPVDAAHPQGRTVIFLGDLVDRGPDSPGVLRLAMGMTAAGHALAVPGNHENKLIRALDGQKVTVSHGLETTLAQLAAEPAEFRAAVREWARGLVSHQVLDEGRLVVAHAGLKESYHNRASGRVRAFALYGDTTGETDEFGLPVRYPWVADYRGAAMVLYGHTPTPTLEWVNNTLCLDTGCVFGGRLSALRYPEKESVQIPAQRVWYEPARPFATAESAAAPGASDSVHGSGLDIADVVHNRLVETSVLGRVTVRPENAAGALEVMSRFATEPRWLPYLPSTMAPAPTMPGGDYLEHPDQAWAAYDQAGVESVIAEEKHMGSRAVVVLCRGEDAARRRFPAASAGTGAVYTRTGRAFFDAATTERFLDRLRCAADRSGLWDELDSDWVVLDSELLPWSLKADGLLREQYAATGAAARAALPAVLGAVDAAAARGIDVADLRARTARRAANAEAFTTGYRHYCWPTNGLDGVRLAPFAVLASEVATHESRPHDWHLRVADALVAADPDVVTPTRRVIVDLTDSDSRAAGTAWWLGLTAAGGEGMVVKPLAGLVRDRKNRLVQPGLKVRGREYLRLIYGPDYVDALPRLRGRNLGHKRSLALREYALGLESLRRLVDGEPLWRVHQAVFAVLALESEPVDPRL